MDWTAFWSGLVGTTLPAAAVSLLMLVLKSRGDRSLERFKNELHRDVVKLTTWHGKRAEALLTIYVAFCDYLDFIRRALYVPHTEGMNMDPMHDFRRTLDRHMVYLDDTMAAKIGRYQGELLYFWNTSMMSLGEHGEAARKEVQRKLDYEVPEYLPRLRRDINQFLDPYYEQRKPATA